MSFCQCFFKERGGGAGSEGRQGAEVYRGGNVAGRLAEGRAEVYRGGAVGRVAGSEGQMREVWRAGIKKACNLKNNIVKKIQVSLWRHLAGGIPPAGV